MSRNAPRAGLRERLSYRFDRFMERGTLALILGLSVISVTIIVGIVVVMVVINATGGDYDTPALLWMSLMRTMDAGTMGGDTGTPQFLLGMLAVTIAGVFVISTLIGILNNGLEDKLAALREGRSRVLERDHVLVLGWNQQVFAVISELIAAGARRRRTVIVILADRDRAEMEREIRERVTIGPRVRIVCRSGSPSDLGSLPIANPDESRAIVVLGPDGQADDVFVLKTILAVTGRPERRAEPYRIVAEVRRPESAGIAKLIAGDQVHLLAEDELLARIIAQTCRQSGLSVVYQELLDFAGQELHVEDVPALVGRTFGEAVALMVGAIPIGLVSDGQARLDPPPGTVIGEHDRMVVLAEDQGSAHIGTPVGDADLDAGAIVAPRATAAVPERTLILGWNGRGSLVIRELDQYVAPGSEVLVVSALGRVGDEVAAIGGLRNAFAEGRAADTVDRRVLDGLAIETFSHVIVLCESDDRTSDIADGRTLVTLLHLRDIGARRGKPFSIVSEMTDVRNRELAEVARPDDFIVSARVLSLLLAQVAETPDLADVFRDLFDADGAEVYVRGAGDYVVPGREVAFATVQAAAQGRAEVAIGYRRADLASDAAAGYGVILNPAREARIRFAPGDQVVVVAEA